MQVSFEVLRLVEPRQPPEGPAGIAVWTFPPIQKVSRHPSMYIAMLHYSVDLRYGHIWLAIVYNPSLPQNQRCVVTMKYCYCVSSPKVVMT